MNSKNQAGFEFQGPNVDPDLIIEGDIVITMVEDQEPILDS